MTPTTKPLAPQESAPGIVLVYFDAGGGHRAAMSALKRALEQSGRPWKISCLNLQELLDETDLVRKLTGIRVQDTYNLMLKKGWTLGTAKIIKPFHAMIRAYHDRFVELLEPYWRKTQPQLVVSMIPNFNRALADSVRKVLPDAPFVTILTDMADYPPHFWMEPESEYVICGSERAVEQALEMGLARERVFRVSGMILNPAFYSAPEGDRANARRKLGLEAGLPTGLVMFGGQGSGSMLTIARRLAGLENLQLIFICGHNQALRRQLSRMRMGMPAFVEGFTTEMQRYMRLSDFFIGKPGPGSISEALHMGLPVLIERNAWTLPQERFNAEWVEKNGLGIVMPSFRQVRAAVERLMQPGTLEGFRARAQALENRAVFEIPDILDGILKQTEGGRAARKILPA